MQGFTRFWVALIFVLCLLDPAAGAETYDLRPDLKVGRTSHIETLLEVTGNLKLPDQEQVKTLPMQAVGSASYDERLVDVEAATARRSIRCFDKATAKLTIDGKSQEPLLDPEHSAIVGDWTGQQLRLFCPDGHIAREELDLLSTPGDSLIVDALLPDQPVAIEDRWQHTPDLMAALVGIDAVSTSDAESVLVEANDAEAKCELQGKLLGAIGGVATEIEVKAKYTFDFAARRVTWLALLIKENRSIGHAAPGVDATARLQLKIEPIQQSKLLPAVVAGKQHAPTDDQLLLAYYGLNDEFSFLYDRRWLLLTEEPKGAVFRLIDRGELVAQCNVVPLTRTEKPVPLAKFQLDIQKALGEGFGQFVTASQNSDDPSRLVYRVVATGKVEELPMQWIYYLMTTPAGQQSLLIFAVETPMLEAFGNADEAIVAQLKFNPIAQQTAQGGTSSDKPALK
jgi:hypothetical protein